MSTPNHARIAALAQQLRAEALGTTGPEMNVCVNSGLLLEFLAADDAAPRATGEDAAGEEVPDVAAIERAGLVSTIGHLSALVDHLRAQLRKAAATMSALHGTASPIDESRGDLDARIPYDAFHVFVDEHAALLHELAHGLSAEPEVPAVSASASVAAPERSEGDAA